MVLEHKETMIPIRKIVVLLVGIELYLIGMHFFPEAFSTTIRNRFDLNGEANIPTWYSTELLFAISASSLILYALSATDRQSRKFWLVFGCVYGFLSLDEAARLHEVIDKHIKWVVVYGPPAGLFFVFCANHLCNGDNQALRNFIVGGLSVYALGGLVGETVSSLLDPLSPVLQQVEFVWEEGLEMLGSILVLTGCLQEINRVASSQGGWAPMNMDIRSKSGTYTPSSGAYQGGMASSFLESGRDVCIPNIPRSSAVSSRSGEVEERIVD